MLSRLDFNKYGAGMLSNKNLMDFRIVAAQKMNPWKSSRPNKPNSRLGMIYMKDSRSYQGVWSLVDLDFLGEFRLTNSDVYDATSHIIIHPPVGSGLRRVPKSSCWAVRQFAPMVDHDMIHEWESLPKIGEVIQVSCFGKE